MPQSNLPFTASLDWRPFANGAARMESAAAQATQKIVADAKKADKAFSGIGQGFGRSSGAGAGSGMINRLGGGRGAGSAGAGGSWRIGQAAMQMQDVAVQLQMGAKYSTIIAQQGSQIASVFGVRGAIYGGIVAILAGYYSWMSGEDALNKKIQENTARDKERFRVKKEIAEIDREIAEIGDESGSVAIENEYRRKMERSFGMSDRGEIDAMQAAAGRWREAKRIEQASATFKEQGKEVEKIVALRKELSDGSSVQKYQAALTEEARLEATKNESAKKHIEFLNAQLESKKAQLVVGRELEENMANLGEQFKSQADYASRVAESIGSAKASAEQRIRDEHMGRMDNLVNAQQDLQGRYAARGDELHRRTFGRTGREIRSEMRADRKRERDELKWERKMRETGGLQDIHRMMNGEFTGRDPITGKRMTGREARSRAATDIAARKEREKLKAEISDENIKKLVDRIGDLLPR